MPFEIADPMRNIALDRLVNGAALSAITPHAGLGNKSTGNFQDNGTEFSGGSYARVNITGSYSGAASETDGVIANDAKITFPASTGAWGTATDVAIYSASTAGDLLMYGDLGSSQVIGSGETYEFDTGALTISLDAEGRMFTNRFSQELLAWITEGTTAASFTPHFGLFTAAPTRSTAGTEVSGTNYARVDISGAFGSQSSQTDGSATSTADIDFATPGSGGWGTVTHWGIFDAASSGNLYCFGQLSAPRTIAQNDTVSFKTGQVIVCVFRNV